MIHKTPRPYISYILETLETIAANTPPTQEAFMQDPNVQDATLMRLQDICEQLVHIRDNFPEYYDEQHQDSWYKLIGLRNVISHGYREIDFTIIWVILEHDLAPFREYLLTLDSRGA